MEKSWSSTEANANSCAAVKAKHILGYVRHRVASKSREGIVSPPLSTGEATDTSYRTRQNFRFFTFLPINDNIHPPILYALYAYFFP